MAIGKAQWAAGTLFALLLAMGSGCASPSGAEQYYRSVSHTIDGQRSEMPSVIASAEQAARLYVEDDYPIAVTGDGRFMSEALGRSGGMMRLIALPADSSHWKGIVLYALGSRSFSADLQKIELLRAGGSYVVVFGREEELRQAKAFSATFDNAINTHASRHDGIMRDEKGAWVIPTDGVADMSAMWTWTAEFVAACTRLEKMPTMYLGYVNEGGREREKRIGDAKFHSEVPIAVPAGQLGGEYLATLKANLEAIHREEMDDIRTVAAIANRTREIGGTNYVITMGHAMQTLLAVEPSLFTELMPEQPLAHEPNGNDFIYYVGYSVFVQNNIGWDHLLGVVRDGKATVAWSVATYNPVEMSTIPEGDIIIDQHWAEGDADITVPGYDIKIIPTSGVLAETTFWMVNAEMRKPSDRMSLRSDGSAFR